MVGIQSGSSPTRAAVEAAPSSGTTVKSALGSGLIQRNIGKIKRTCFVIVQWNTRTDTYPVNQDGIP